MVFLRHLNSTLPGTAPRLAGSPALPPFRSRVRAVLIGWTVGASGSGHPRRLLRFWPFWEAVSRRVWPVCELPTGTDSMIALHFTRHHGKPVRLNDGTAVHSGDGLAEIHFNNHLLAETMTEGTEFAAWSGMTMFRRDLQTIAQWMQQPDFPHRVRAVYGISLFAPACARFGMTVRSRPRGIHAWFDRLFLHGLLILYSSGGAGRLSYGSSRGMYPAEVWLSSQELIRRFGRPDCPIGSEDRE